MFDHTFIISLPTRKDRRKRITHEFKKSQIATLGENASFFDAVRPEDAGDFPSIGARGCFMSHLGCLQRAKEMGCQTTCIIEDDVVFTSDFKNRWPYIMNTLQENPWDIFYGGYFFPQAPSFHPEITAPGISHIEPEMAVQLAHFVAFKKDTTASLINYLESILGRPGGHPEGGPMHVDGAYSWFRKSNPQLTTVAANPIVANQGASRSDIANLRWFDRTPGLRHLANAMRLLKQQ